MHIAHAGHVHRHRLYSGQCCCALVVYTYIPSDRSTRRIEWAIVLAPKSRMRDGWSRKHRTRQRHQTACSAAFCAPSTAAFRRCCMQRSQHVGSPWPQGRRHIGELPSNLDRSLGTRRPPQEYSGLATDPAHVHVGSLRNGPPCSSPDLAPTSMVASTTLSVREAGTEGPGAASLIRDSR